MGGRFQVMPRNEQFNVLLGTKETRSKNKRLHCSMYNYFAFFYEHEHQAPSSTFASSRRPQHAAQVGWYESPERYHLQSIPSSRVLCFHPEV